MSTDLFLIEGRNNKMVMGIRHFSIIASSEASVEFYKKFGFKEYKRIVRDYDQVVLLNGYGVGLKIFIDPTHPTKLKPELLRLRQLTFCVDNIEKTIDEFDIEAGLVMAYWFGCRFCLIANLDGNSI